MARCSKCGYPLLPKHGKCPKCGAEIEGNNNVTAKPSFDFDAPRTIQPVQRQEQAKQVSNTPINGVDVVSRKAVWSIAPGQLARRVSEKELADCSAVNGVVIQDGVTAAVFVDGQLTSVMDGGLYQFNPEKVIERTRTIVNSEKTNPVVEKQSLGKRVSSFFTGLIGAKKHAEKPDKAERRVEAWKEMERESIRRTVVSIYLISNRLFQMAFGFEKQADGTCSFKPYHLRAGIQEIEIGVNMQMRISNFEAFRLNYLNDQRKVSVIDLQQMMSPWVQQILAQTVEPMQLTGISLTNEQKEQIKLALKQELEHRLSGVELVQVMDITTDSADFEHLRQQEHELWVSEQEADFYVRKNEFLNRFTGYQQEQQLIEQSMSHDHELNREREEHRFRTDMNKLNQDQILSDDELEHFVELHDMEVRLRRALQNADEQKRMMDVENILNEVKAKKLVSDDEMAAIEESIHDKRFERQQMSDVLQHAALTKASIEKMRAEAGLYTEKTKIDMQREQADFEALKQRNGFDIEKAEMEVALYGKRYVLEKQQAIDSLEMKGIELDADLSMRRKQDDYTFEQRKREDQFSFDTRKRDTEFDFEIDVKRQEWEDERQFKLDERQFRLDDHQVEMENRREEQRQQRATFDFDMDKQKRSFDFDMQKKEDEANFESRKRNTEFDFDLEGKKQERDDARQEKQDDRQFRLDDHQVEMENRREEQRQHRAEFDFDMDKQKRSFDFDLDQRGKDADVERSMKLDSHAQDMADRESRRRQEELEQKGNIAMRNMQMMMEAKRAARQDELQHEKEMQQSKFEAEERRMQTQKEMTAEQIMAAQIREMDAGAQAKFAESFSAGKSADREREMAEEKAQMYERMMQQMQTGNQQNAQMQQQMMQQMMEMAKMGFQANANVATGRIDALRENIQPSAPATPEPTPAPTPAPEPPKPLRLNTSWLRQHGYEGSFNELAGQLANLGGDISQDFDEQGNPVIVVDNLTDAQVMDVLVKLGVNF